MSGSTLLETRDLALEYGSHAVVADPNTVVRPGEIVGLLGANGVGETTTLLGLGRGTQAGIRVGELVWRRARDPLHHRNRCRLGFLPGGAVSCRCTICSR